MKRQARSFHAGMILAPRELDSEGVQTMVVQRRTESKVMPRLAVQRASAEDKAVPVQSALGDLTLDKDLRPLGG